MLIERRERNPFDMVKASDFTDGEILDHWVDLSSDHGLEALIKPRLVMPMILLGGKGSGKTHLLRYFSAPVQTARHGGDPLAAMRADGYLGIYVRAEGLNTPKFARRGQDDETWSAIFAMYFEIWLATSLLLNVAPAVALVSDPARDRAFAAAAGRLFNEEPALAVTSLDTLLAYLEETRRTIDLVVDNAALTRDVSGIRINFSPGRLVYGLPDVLQATYPEISSTLLVYLIDEVENLTSEQQRFVNTLVRYRKGNASIKVGARLYGIRTWETLAAGEPIKRDSEYEQVELDDFLRNHDEVYGDFCRSLIVRRLEFHNMRAARVTVDKIAACFDEVETADFSARTALALVAPYDAKGRERPYFEKLRGLLKEGGYAPGLADDVISALAVTGSPLLEKLALFALYKGWRQDPAELTAHAMDLGSQARALSSRDVEAASALRTNLRHFRSDLLAQLYRDCNKSSPYAGLATLIHLSQGIPRNLLSSLKHIYRRSLFAGEQPFADGRISVESQSLGVKDSAAWFWEDAQPDEGARDVREAIDVLATLFRTMRFSERPPECDCATFSVRLSDLTEESRRIIAIAEKWSYLIKVKGGGSDKNSESVRAKYQLGPMLAPRWGLSQHRRGTVELDEELCRAVFDPEHRRDLSRLFERRVAKLLGRSFVKVRAKGQEQLFA